MRPETHFWKVLVLAERRGRRIGEKERHSLKWGLGFIHKPRPDNH